MKKKLFFKFFVFTVIGALVTMTSCKDYDDDISGLQSQVTTVKSDLSTLQTSVTGAQNDATAAKTAAADALAKAKEALAAAEAAGDAEAITALQTEVKGLETSIEGINTKLQGLEGLEGKIKDKLAEIEKANADQLKAIKEDVAEMFVELKKLVKPVVSSLTFEPEFTSYDGTPQFPVHFLGEWMQSIEGEKVWDEWYANDSEEPLTAYKGITYAKFNVSPSNATLDDFEVVGLLEKTSEILHFYGTKSTTEPLLKAVVEDVTLESGVLTVPILIHSDFYDWAMYEGEGPMAVAQALDDENFSWPEFFYYKNISIALQVKNKNVENSVSVSSEFIPVRLAGPMFASIELVKENAKVGRWKNRLPTYMDDDIVSDDYWKPSASLELWNGYNRNTSTYDSNFSIDLNDSLRAIAKFNDSWRILEEFGYDDIEKDFVFELIDIDNEGVNQSSYVTLKDGVLKVKPAADGTANQAAVGRTPVVLAKVVDKDGHVYAVGYLKIVITEQVDNTPVKFEFTLEDYIIGCNDGYNLTEVDLETIDFDQVFNHERIKLGKDAFFKAYRSTDEPIHARVIKKPEGANDYEIKFMWNVSEPTQGQYLSNYISAEVFNTAPAGKYVIETTLRGRSNNPNIVITWNIEVKLPDNIKLTANEKFLSNGIYLVEPTVFRQDPMPPSSTPYEGLLNNAFMHKEGSFDFGIMQEDQKCDEYLDPFFVFTEVPEGFKISTEGDEVFDLDGNHAAQIYEGEEDGEFYITLNTNNNEEGNQWGNYTPLSNASKELLAAGWVKVQPRARINGAETNVIDLYKEFTVKFTYPLTFNFADKYDVWDQGTGNKNKVIFNIAAGIPANRDILVIDFLGNKIRFGTGGISTPGLVNHYEIANTDFVPEINFDFDKITTDLPGGVLPKGMAMKKSLDESDFDGNDYATRLVIAWSNSSGGSVQQAFDMYIPVSLEHKWGVLESKITITVNPGQGLDVQE